jgi:hypothetical protein
MASGMDLHTTLARARRRDPIGPLAAGALLVVAAEAWSQPGVVFSCPMRVQTHAASVTDGVAGGFGTAFHAGSLAYLVDVAVYEGEPRADRLRPPRREGSRLQWSVGGWRQPAVLLCRYEGGVALGRTLAASLQRCEALLRPGRPDAAAGEPMLRTEIRCE